MTYGIPYKGSKNRLATTILSLLPPAHTLYDLFCGGCAITHAALISGKYSHVVANDINPIMPKLLHYAIDGRYQHDTRWISKKEFYALRGIDPYVTTCWSFGNDLKTYLYSDAIAPLKKALHHAILLDDHEPLLSLGHNLTHLATLATPTERYLAAKHHFRLQGEKVLLQSLQQLNRLNSLQQLQHIDHNHIHTPQINPTSHSKPHHSVDTEHTSSNDHPTHTHIPHRNLPDSTTLTTYATTYQQIPIAPNSIIYADIPYAHTNTYTDRHYTHQPNGFDHAQFYEWALQQTSPLFISSFSMPSEYFIPLAKFTHRALICNPHIRRTAHAPEHLFIPRHQIPQILPLIPSLNP